MAHDHLIELLDLDAEVLHDYFRDVIGWVGREAVGQPHVVDLGAGSGTASLALARELPDATVTAVDLSPEMLAHLRSRADAAGLGDRIRTVQADLDQPWPDLGPTGVIWAAASLHHLADPATALASAFAALRPDGLLVVAEVDAFPRFLTGTPGEQAERRVHDEAAKRRHEAGLHMHENWGERMTQAGFRSVTERRFDIDLRPPVARRRRPLRAGLAGSDAARPGRPAHPGRPRRPRRGRGGPAGPRRPQRPYRADGLAGPPLSTGPCRRARAGPTMDRRGPVAAGRVRRSRGTATRRPSCTPRAAGRSSSRR
ncbi:trans-aconitate 2-methyltransferase [Micromonospora sp. HUAS LYJ1]|uniref:class I SAM-dependent methyltransferase n=1 Tax=Micromonospora sp. HUAS LYJ1 TaxID=3061626 RepID=UPI0026724FF8|nr:class I SAM-dependent methyltransferase [Micromonospora sp. HUAS LYJ1]WKU02926.1 class I SAM-dependent methyltransferase [Micromonospora sp. HUAS LYJ1]